MDFKKKLKQRFYIALFYITLGLILVIAAYLGEFENYFVSSFGIALLVMGVIRTIRHCNITRDAQSIRQQELAETDERNLMISERAKSWAFSFSILLAGLSVIVLSLLGYHDLAQPFAWFVCLMTLLYWICYHIVKRKY